MGSINRPEFNIFYLNDLTIVEMEVLYLVVMGKTEKDIAQERSKSINTIKNQKNKIYKKLGLSNRDDERSHLLKTVVKPELEKRFNNYEEIQVKHNQRPQHENSIDYLVRGLKEGYLAPEVVWQLRYCPIGYELDTTIVSIDEDDYFVVVQRYLKVRIGDEKY